MAVAIGVDFYTGTEDYTTFVIDSWRGEIRVGGAYPG